MNIYLKIMILGIIGLITLGIVIGVVTPSPASFEFNISTDLIILYIFLQLPNEDRMFFLFLLFILGYFATSED